MSNVDIELRSKVIEYLLNDLTLDELEQIVVPLSFADDRAVSLVQSVDGVLACRDGQDETWVRSELAEQIRTMRIATGIIAKWRTSATATSSRTTADLRTTHTITRQFEFVGR